MIFLNINGLSIGLSLCSRQSLTNMFYLTCQLHSISGESLRHCVEKDSEVRSGFLYRRVSVIDQSKLSKFNTSCFNYHRIQSIITYIEQQLWIYQYQPNSSIFSYRLCSQFVSYYQLWLYFLHVDSSRKIGKISIIDLYYGNFKSTCYFTCLSHD